MDSFRTNMGTLCILLFAVVTVIESSKDNQAEWLAKSLRAVNREKRTHNKDRKRILDASKKTLKEADDKETCCQNGGICIMNTFCHCQKNFYGRFCEHRVRHRSCGTIRHGTWMASGCHLCHCFDGKMTCKKNTIRGCNKLSYVEGYEKNPDYMVGMDKIVEDYDKFYDEYDYASETEVTSGTARVGVPVWSITMAVISFAICKNTFSLT